MQPEFEVKQAPKCPRLGSLSRRGIVHVGLRSRNLERTRKFYREILGLNEELRHSGVVFVPVGHDSLVLYNETSGASDFHFGFEVATSREVDRWRDMLRSKDVPIYDDISEGGYLSFKIKDPDGHWLEIRQKRPAPAQSKSSTCPVRQTERI